MAEQEGQVVSQALQYKEQVVVLVQHTQQIQAAQVELVVAVMVEEHQDSQAQRVRQEQQTQVVVEVEMGHQDILQEETLDQVVLVW